jgi:hypothetical protein
LQAERLGTPNPICQALIAGGLTQMAFGRWRKGAEVLDKVAARLRDHSAGLTYELRNAQSYALINHYALGNLRILAERLPALVRDGEETGDLLFLANLKTGSAFIHRLALDEPAFARKDIRQTLEKLPLDGFYHQRYLELAALGNIDLYCGEFTEGWELLLQRWNAVSRSGLLLAQMIRITCLELRARMALAVGSITLDPERRRPYLALAHRDAKALRRERIEYGTALAHRLATIEAWLRGSREEALGSALLAEMAFNACDMALHANVMKRCRGLAKGLPGQDLVQEAETWMHGQGIVSPPRMTAMYLPGMNLEEK